MFFSAKTKNPSPTAGSPQKRERETAAPEDVNGGLDEGQRTGSNNTSTVVPAGDVLASGDATPTERMGPPANAAAATGSPTTQRAADRVGSEEEEEDGDDEPASQRARTASATATTIKLTKDSSNKSDSSIRSSSSSSSAVRGHDNAEEEEGEDRYVDAVDVEDGARGASVVPSAASDSASESSSDDESDTNEMSERGMREDRAKRYPRFTADYAEKCKAELVPFIHEVLAPVVSAVPARQTHYDPGALPAAPQRRYASRFVLYGQYVYVRTLGKGTFSKVVLAEQLSPSPAMQQLQLSLSDHTTPTSSGSGGGAARIALKIFRDSDAYREACWDEFSILSALCCPTMPTPADGAGAGAPPQPQMPPRLTTVRSAAQTGMMECYGHMGRFMTPIDYIPHPLHPAVVYPVMGPSLLHVTRAIRKTSCELVAALKREKKFNAAGSSSNSRVTAPSSSSPPSTLSGRVKHRIWYRGLPLPRLRVVLYQILVFLRFIHARGVVHTDLKPENVLFETATLLPSPVKIGFRYFERPAGGATEENMSVEGRKILHDAQKLASAASLAEMSRSDNGRPPAQQGDVAWKLPPGHRAPQAGPADAHTITVPMPLFDSIRVVDLGAAQFTGSFTHKSRIDGASPVSYDPIQTSHYRSPETIMGTGWGASADIFSLGCMVPELLTGDCLFMPQDSFEHLALMRHIIGPFWKQPHRQSSNNNNNKGSSGSGSGGGGDGDGGAPSHPLHPQDDRNGAAEGPSIEEVFNVNYRTFEHYFDSATGELQWPVTEEMASAYALRRRRRRGQDGDASASNAESEEEDDDDDDEDDELLDPYKPTTPEDEAFVYEKPTLVELLGGQPLLLDLCQRMLRYNPLDRITAAEALEHPFFHTLGEQL